MIDWLSLFLHTLWVLGASILLATISYHYWLATTTHRSLKSQFNQPTCLIWVWVAFLLISLSLVLTGVGWGRQLIWGTVFILSLYNVIAIRREILQK